ncbi:MULTISPECIES: lipoxygenase family protein [unclassified Microcoleus]|uniref:lipoxygenase family protein n=1 Tax=unclassified Microcoleus TaxID=2642155 RepID=UPI0025CE2682|nr:MULTISPECIES: lipoxygenase family protein [unclassified Microcoleus]
MPLSSGNQNSPSGKSTLINTLLTLYKFVKFGSKFFPGNYNYNYDYIPSLAMTTSPPLPLINLNIPSQELPSKEWVMLVVQKITILNANKARHFDKGIPSFSVGISTEENSGVDRQIEVLKNTEQEIEAADSKEDLTNIAWKIAEAAKQITQELSPGGISFSVGGDNESAESSEIDEQLREIDEQFAKAYQSSETSEALDFSIGVGSDLENTSGESLDLAFKEIIKHNIKLLDLESEQSSNIDFSTGGFQDFPSLEDYNSLFVDIPLPQISQRFQEDLIFAYMRVAGPNPLMLQQLSEQNKPLQVSNEKYQQIIERFEFSDSLEAALQEGRLYQADYSMLKNMAQGSFPNNVKKYPCAPLALFAVPPVSSSSRSLIPVAIQCQQPSVSENPPVFTPLDGDNWMVAKTIVNMADSNYHELVSHLGRTHLFVEPFVLATKRKLPANHKLRILLEPHFEGTILINYGAHKTLIANGGKVDQLLASTIEDDRVIAVEGAKSYLHKFNDVMFPKTLTSQGVRNSAQLPDHPYRDDGLLIWDAINTWVRAYLSIYYTSDQQLLEDKALQNWAQELVSDQGGRLKNFGEDASGAIKTLNYLIDAVSSVIFTASAQHAAVNFPQSELMSYTPAFPFAIYSPAPTSSEKQGNFMSMLPSLDRAQTQIGVDYLLGSVYYTQLGQYNKGHFKDAKVMSYLGEFQNQLRDIEMEISKRNRSRLMPYKFLLPSQIPQSINI